MIKIGKGRTVGSYVLEAIMLVICTGFVIPFYFLIVNTLKTQQEAVNHPLALPHEIFLGSYANAFKQMEFLRTFTNTVIITLFSVALIVILGSMAAYPIVRRKNKVTKALMFYFLLGFMVPTQTTIVPLFIIMQRLKLVNSIHGMIVLYSGGCIFAFFLYQGFIQSVPKDLEESAIIDGCNIFKMFWKIVFPLLKPVTTTLVIFQTMWIWNDFLMAYLFLNTRKVSTLVLEVYRGIGQYSNDWPVMLATMVIVLIPIIIFYFAVQKHIISGLTSGAIKG